MNDNWIYHCEICGTDISKELADFTWDLCDFHRLCHKHKELYMNARSRIKITWDKRIEQFIPEIVEPK